MGHPVIQRFARNLLGRDFIVGDLHGAFGALRERMRYERFDETVDRLFSVGDLIDRGPDSARVLKLLAKPYVFAVKGNHEHNVATLTIEELRSLGDVNWNGMEWINDIDDTTLNEIKRRLKQLPVVMEIETRKGLVGVVHADVPSGQSWQAFTEALQAGCRRTHKIALHGRQRITAKDATGVPGIGRVFVGHTVLLEGPTRFGNIWAIDTGACHRSVGLDEGCVTMLQLECRSSTVASYDNSRQVLPGRMFDRPTMSSWQA